MELVRLFVVVVIVYVVYMLFIVFCSSQSSISNSSTTKVCHEQLIHYTVCVYSRPLLKDTTLRISQCKNLSIKDKLYCSVLT